MTANGQNPSTNGHTNTFASPGPSYSFPDQKLRTQLKNASKTPLVLVACGSFSPITYLHLRMFEMASDYVKADSPFELVGAYLSPVSDAYKKKGLASSQHRIEMCRMATESAEQLTIDPWEALLPEYTRTATVLDRFDYEINEVRGGIQTADGTKKRAQIALLAGADLIETFATPNLWSDEDLEHILVRYGVFAVERSGTDLDQALSQLKHSTRHVYIIRQLVKNDISSTKVRDFISKDMSINYLSPPNVVSYISQNSLYKDRHDIIPQVQS